LIAGGGVENDHFVIQSDDELIPGDDEFEGGGVVDLPEEAGFELGLGGGDFFLQFFNFGEVGFDFGIEFLEGGILAGEGGFEFAFAGEVEALKLVEGMEVGFAICDDDAVGVIEGGESFAGGGVGEAELFVFLFLSGCLR